MSPDKLSARSSDMLIEVNVSIHWGLFYLLHGVDHGARVAVMASINKEDDMSTRASW